MIGNRVKRIDGYSKCTGQASFGDDLTFPGQLFAACCYTQVSCGKVSNINIAKAQKIPGVLSIIKYDDVPGTPCIGPIRKDQLPIINDTVYYSGDVIAVAAASSQQAAYQACEAITAEYEAIPGVFDVEQAVKKGARLIHPEFKSNIVVHYPLRKGNFEKSKEISDQTITRTYRTGFVEHAYIEPESVSATCDPSTGGVNIYGSIQNPNTTRTVVALYMNLKLNQVNVFSSTLGGSFGGKDDIVNAMACRVALLSFKTGRPVKLTNKREQSFIESYKRHPYLMEYTVSFNNDGKINGMKIDILSDSGAYSSQSFFVNWRSVVQATGPYEIPNVHTDIRSVYTNNCYTGAFRGFGSPQIIFAQESLMDEIAKICGLSPIKTRQLNGFKSGSITASGQKLRGHKVSLAQVLSETKNKSQFQKISSEYKKYNKSKPRYRYGIGLAISYRGCSLGAEGVDSAFAVTSVLADGSAYIGCGLNENGQGLQTTFCQIAACTLGIEIDDITFLAPQTAVLPDSGPTVASRSTLMGGKAVENSCLEVKKTLFSVIKNDLKATKLSQTIWQDGTITNTQSGISLKFKEAIKLAINAGKNLSAYGCFNSPKVSWNDDTGQGDAYFTYVYGCNVAQIKIDTYTGKIDVIKITAAHDVGKVINMLGAEGQVYGGVTQGVGYSILEDFHTSSGQVKTQNFDTYLIPTSKDIGEIEPILIENPDSHGPYGAKSLGEPTLELCSAAINNALFFATGVHSDQLPITLEKVFLNKPLNKPSRQSEQTHTQDSSKQAYRLENITTHSPTNLQEAHKLMKNQTFKIIAGGTDVLIQLRSQSKPVNLIDISQLSQLQGITQSDKEITIGALTCFCDIIDNSIINKYYPLLISACKTIGSVQIRNQATIGGNIVNAAPCADSLPPLILYDAYIVCAKEGHTRKIAISDFVKKHYQTQIEPDEILTHICIPLPSYKPDYHHYYQLGRRNAVNITRMSICLQLKMDESQTITHCAIVPGSVFSKPKRLSSVENFLTNKRLSPKVINSATKKLSDELEINIGGRWSSEYKIPVFCNMLKGILNEQACKSKI